MFNFDKEDIFTMAFILAFAVVFTVILGAVTHTL